jgi:23S rRNA pseudouridine2605 synthase
MRINAFLSRAGIASRRKADDLVKAGRVSVNGQTASLNTQASESDKVSVDGKPVALKNIRYIMLNKPRGYITTKADPEGRRTVVELVGDNNVSPVGRLDFNTTGLLLLTNDGDLAHKLTHPKFELNKTYILDVRAEVTDEVLNKLSNGVLLEDGMTAPAKAEKINAHCIKLTIHEGRNRQVRRMAEALGLSLKSLHRSNYGPFDLTGVDPGRWRELRADEVTKIKLLSGTIAPNAD